MISLKINGQNLEVREGTTVLQAAAEMGVVIPTLCYHKDLSPFGGCRLCVVKIEGARLPMTACNLPVSPGLVVETDTPEVIHYRKAVLRMLLSRYYDAAYKSFDGTLDIEQDSELAHWARFYEIDMRAVMAKKPFVAVDSDPNPYVWVDMNKCIQCTRCVRACAEIQGRFVWSQSFRGYQARIVAGADSTMLASRCESCGACVVYCPTGALDNKMSVNKGRADRLVRTVCNYCGIGCTLDLNVQDDVNGSRVIRVTSNTDRHVDSVNGLHLCVKGRYGYEFIHHPQRHRRPKVRQYLLEGNGAGSGVSSEAKLPGGNGSQRPAKRGKFVEVDWDTALTLAARGLQRVRDQNGANAVGVLASGRLLNEENYLLNKLARQALGTDNLDVCAHVYNASEVEGLVETLGLPAMTNSLEDIGKKANSLLVIGSNLTEQHPVFGAQVRQAVLRRKVKLVAASPDFYNIDEYAALSLYHQPNSEAVLVNGISALILKKGWQDGAEMDKYPELADQARAAVEKLTPEAASLVCGVSVEAMEQAAQTLAQNSPAAVIWSTSLGDRESRKECVQALVYLQLILGNLDKPGGGLNPLRSQNNGQGASDMGCLPGWLPSYQRLLDAGARTKLSHAWGAPLPETQGMNAWEMLAAAGEGKLKALYLVGEDIVNTSADGARVRRSLEELDFLVLQEIATSETTRYADILLPGVSFAEKTGTFTSSERRIQLVRQAIQPLGDARPDWQITADLAKRILMESAPLAAKAPYSVWEYEGTEQVMEEISALAPIYDGVSHAILAHGKKLFSNSLLTIA